MDPLPYCKSGSMVPVDLSANCEGWIYDPNGSGIQILGIRSRDPFSGSTDMPGWENVGLEIGRPRAQLRVFSGPRTGLPFWLTGRGVGSRSVPVGGSPAAGAVCRIPPVNGVTLPRGGREMDKINKNK